MQTPTNQPNPTETIPFWNDPAKRAIIYQIGVLVMVGCLSYYLITNTIANLERQAIATGFGFLERESAFEIAFGGGSYPATTSVSQSAPPGGESSPTVPGVQPLPWNDRRGDSSPWLRPDVFLPETRRGEDGV